MAARRSAVLWSAARRPFEGMAQLHILLGGLLSEEDDAEVLVGIETDHGPWTAALAAAGYLVFPVNPQQSAWLGRVAFVYGDHQVPLRQPQTVELPGAVGLAVVAAAGEPSPRLPLHLVADMPVARADAVTTTWSSRAARAT